MKQLLFLIAVVIATSCGNNHNGSNTTTNTTTIKYTVEALNGSGSITYKNVHNTDTTISINNDTAISTNWTNSFQVNKPYTAGIAIDFNRNVPDDTMHIKAQIYSNNEVIWQDSMNRSKSEEGNTMVNFGKNINVD